MRLPPGLLKRLIREGYSAPDAMREAWKRVRKNPGARWHGEKATEAERDRARFERKGSIIGSHFFRGKREAHRESQDESRRLRLNPTTAYDVFLRGKKIDTVFQSGLSSAEEVKRSLVEHDGYDPDIHVVKQRKKSLPPLFRRRRNPGAAWHKEQARLAEDMEKRETRPRRRTYLKGMADAHTLSEHESRKMGLNPRGSEADPTAADELLLFIENSEPLYRQQLLPIYANLDRKRKRGVYDREKVLAGGYGYVPGRRSRRRHVAKATLERKNPDIGMTFNTKAKANRYAVAMQKLGHSVSLVPQQYGTWRVVIHETKKNPIAVYNPPEGRLIYGRLVSLKATKTGEEKDGTDLGGYKHSFANNSRVKVFGLPDGSVLLKSAAGKRLWQDR